jgi:hypothetical protein
VCCASWSPSLPSLYRVRAQRKTARTRARSNQIGTLPPGRWGNARRRAAPAPQSKPVTPRLSPRGAGLRRWWHPGFGLRILAAGPANVDCTPIAGAHVNHTTRSLLGLVRGRGHRLNWSPAAGPVSHRAPDAESFAAGLRGREDETRVIARPAARSSNSIRSMSARTCSSPTSRQPERRSQDGIAARGQSAARSSARIRG